MVTLHAVLYPPSTVVTVIVAVPIFSPEIRPFATVAIVGSLDIQLTDLSVAFNGATVAVIVPVDPIVIVSVELSKVIPVTFVTLAATVTTHEAFTDVAVLQLTVIVQDPMPTGVTSPVLAFTVATFTLLEVHVIVLSVVFVGNIVAVSV